jgi:hypothetical protein
MRRVRHWRLRHSAIRAFAMAGVLFASSVQPSGAQSPASARLQTLHVFSGGSDGSNPAGGLISAPDGTLYGTTYFGGSSSRICLGIGCGVVFQVRPPAVEGGHWAFATIYRFQGAGDGELPTSPLARDDGSGALYGTTFGDRIVPNGNVFRLAPPAAGGADAWTFENIYIFRGGADGTLIDASTSLVVANGLVFGITRDGGSSAGCGSHGCGTFFVLTPPAASGAAWTKAVLFSFPGGVGGGAPISTTGFDASGAIDIATTDKHGAIVRLSPPSAETATGRVMSWTERVLYRFSGGLDGDLPFALVLGRHGTVDGVAGDGSYQGGIAFELSPPAVPAAPWRKRTIYAFKPGGFNGNGGPSSLAAAPNGALVGARFGDVDFGAGAIFRLAPPDTAGSAWEFSTPWNFNTEGGPSRNPESVVPGAFGGLYGVLNGGDSDFGAVFALN